MNGFSFCIRDLQTKNVLDIDTIRFNSNHPTPQKHLDLFASKFEAHQKLKQEFNSIDVVHTNNLNSFVPNSLFDENYLAQYLQYNIKLLDNDFITFDTINEIDSKNIYIPFININNYLFDNFGSFDYKHETTVLIESLLRRKDNKEKLQFYTNIKEDFFQIVVIENNKLLFVNTFNYTSKEDFIYYTLFVAEQLKLNPEDLTLTMIGNIKSDSELYTISYKYIKNVQLLETGLNQLSNFTLINQYA